MLILMPLFCQHKTGIDEYHRENVPVSGVENYHSEIETLLVKLRACCPQFDIDGTNNVWIVKPGAKSRGRGKYERHLAFCD